MARRNPRSAAGGCPNSFDPYKEYKVHVLWDGSVVAGVNKVAGLARTSQEISSREGADPSVPHTSPGQVDFSPITLEQGVTLDLEFVAWANKGWDYPNSAQLGQVESLADFRKNVTITLFNEVGQAVVAYNVYKCWVSESHGLPDLDANSTAVVIRSMTLQHEGWERDHSPRPPTEPGFADAGS